METIDLDVSIPSEFQVEVLGLFIKDRYVTSRFSDVLSEEYFDNPVHKVIFRLVRDYYLKYLKVPSRLVVERELGTWMNENKDEVVVPPDYFWQELSRLYAVAVVEQDYLIDKVRQYIQRIQLVRLAKSAVDIARSNDNVRFDSIISEVNGLFSSYVGDSLKAKSEFLLAGAASRIYENPSISKVPTGFRTLDSVLGGGLGNGELGVVMAPTGVGKSFWLVTVGANALKLQKKVLHITLELSREKVIQRYESYISNIPKNQLHLYSERVKSRLIRIRRLLGTSDVLVIEYPSRSLSVDELRALLVQLQSANNFVPDLLLVDYGDILKPTLVYKNEQGWEQLGFIFEKLRGIAQEFNIPVWTGSQTTSDSIKKEIITIVDIAGSFQKVRIADVVLAICRTPSEQQVGRGRFFLDKNRDNRGKVIIPFREDFDTSKFWEESGATYTTVGDGDVVEFSGSNET